MRLIDADELIKYIKIWEIGTSISSDQKEFIDCVNKQLTAFDVDKVVEQLENYLFEKYCIEGDTTIDEIIKVGGDEEMNNKPTPDITPNLAISAYHVLQ